MIKAFKVLTSFSILPIIIFILFLSRIKFYTDDYIQWMKLELFSEMKFKIAFVMNTLARK